MAYIGNNPKWNTGTFTPQSADPANPVEGMVFYADGTSRAEGLYRYTDGAWQPIGSGSSGINHIENSQLEGDTTGYAAYQDAADIRPVDGDGGSPTVTITSTTSTPLRGTASGLITVDAANRQGEGVSYDFTTEEADKFSVQSIEFDYATSANYADGDIRIYIYDVTNATLIEPVPTEVLASESSTKFKAYFQTSDSTSYRLIWHVASTNATGYTFKFDEVRVGPAIRTFGPVASDLEASTASINWSTNTTHTPFEARHGKFLLLEGNISLTGAPDSATLTLTLPYSIDTSVFDANTDNTIAGEFDYIDAGVRVTNAGKIRFATSNTLVFTINDTDVTQASPIIWANTDEINYRIRVPIAGWSSSQQISDDADTRVIACSYSSNASPSVVNGNAVIYEDLEFDTHSAYNPSTGVFTCPAAGKYRVTAHAQTNALSLSGSSEFTIECDQAGSTTRSVSLGVDLESQTVTRAMRAGGSAVFDCQKGDTLTVTYSENIGATTLVAVSQKNSIHIERLSGPSSIAANELVACKYESNAGQVITSTGDFVAEDLIFDTHGAYNTSTGIFTAPASGKYEITVHNRATGNYLAGENFYHELRKLDTDLSTVLDFSRIYHQIYGNNSSGLTAGMASTIFDLQKGQGLVAQIGENLATGGLTLTAVGSENQITIKRLGF